MDAGGFRSQTVIASSVSADNTESMIVEESTIASSAYKYVQAERSVTFRQSAYV